MTEQMKKVEEAEKEKRESEENAGGVAKSRDFLPGWSLNFQYL